MLLGSNLSCVESPFEGFDLIGYLFVTWMHLWDLVVLCIRLVLGQIGCYFMLVWFLHSWLAFTGAGFYQLFWGVQCFQLDFLFTLVLPVLSQPLLWLHL